MGKIFDAIDEPLRQFVLAQPLFFLATAPSGPGGHVNVSPKGVAGTLAVPDARTVAYLDLTGSGIETVAHLRDNGRITLMWCAFAGQPRIVRVHGRGEAIPAADDRFAALVGHFPSPTPPGARSVITVEVTRISDSCGFGVPLMRFEGHRPTLGKWAERMGPGALAGYRRSHNTASIDGLPGLRH
jgi:hypothetical protein